MRLNTHPDYLRRPHVWPTEKFVVEFNQSNGNRFKLTEGVISESTVTIEDSDTFAAFRALFEATDYYKAVQYACMEEQHHDYFHPDVIAADDPMALMSRAIDVLIKYNHIEDTRIERRNMVDQLRKHIDIKSDCVDLTKATAAYAAL